MHRLTHALPLVLLFACSGVETRPEESVRPGINRPFLDPEMKVEDFVARFEGESREIFAEREAIVRALGLAPGESVVDVGAGTGLFTELFAREVGPEGTVWAVEIAPNFVSWLRRRAKQRGLDRVRVVQCSERDVSLPAEWIDAAFVCDTYHHFEYPQSTLASLYRTLRPGGQLFVVDFERIPGVSREWVLGHVRAGKDVVRAEIEAAGFELDEEIAIDGLRENWVLRFRRPATDRPLTERFEDLVHVEGTGALRYRLFAPELAPGETAPLVLFLHGKGERGVDNESQLAWGAWHFTTPEAQRARPCFVLAPQCPPDLEWSDRAAQDLCLKLVRVETDRLPVDPARVYVTGLSMGGRGTWRIAARDPALFAAAVPICGGGDPAQAAALAGVPIWAFHGDADRTVDVGESRAMVEAVRAAGGDVRYTEYPGVRHNSWTRTYTDPRVHAWLFAQAKQ